MIRTGGNEFNILIPIPYEHAQNLKASLEDFFLLIPKKMPI